MDWLMAAGRLSGGCYDLAGFQQALEPAQIFMDLQVGLFPEDLASAAPNEPPGAWYSR